MKKITVFLLAVFALLSASSMVWAADVDITKAALSTVSYIALAAGICIAIGVVGPGIGQGLAVLGATTGIARNPEAAGSIRLTMIIGLALIESLAIYALVVSLLLLYVDPYSAILTSILGISG
jgi:F-type H+-transporting ATPase subunit c